MATKKKMKYQVIKAWLGKVRLESGQGSVLLDENTPQEVLAKHYESGAGKGFIEPVAAATPATQTTVDNGKAGQ